MAAVHPLYNSRRWSLSSIIFYDEDVGVVGKGVVPLPRSTSISDGGEGRNIKKNRRCCF
jgi:hypothetical protein